MKRYVLICTLLAACGAADEATMMMASGGSGGTVQLGSGGSAGGGGGNVAMAGGNAGGAVSVVGAGGSLSPSLDSDGGCQGLPPAVRKLLKFSAQCSRANTVFAVTSQVDCVLPRVFVSISSGGAPPANEAAAVRSLLGVTIELNQGAWTGSLSIGQERFFQFNNEPGKQSGVWICVANGEGKTLSCILISPCEG